MARHTDAGFGASEFLHLLGDAVGRGRIAFFGALGGPFLAFHLGLFYRERSLRHSQDGEVFACLGAALHSVCHLFDIIRMLRDQDDIGAACNAGVQRKPACLVAHDLDAHHPAVAAGSRMDAVNNIGCDIDGCMETEGDIGAINIVVDRLGKANDVEPFLAEQVCGFVGTVTAQAEQAIELSFLISLFHCGDFVHLVIPHNPHEFERGALGAQDCTAHGQNAGKFRLLHFAIVPMNQAVIAIHDPYNLHFVAHPVIERFGHTADCGVEAGAVPARCQNTDAHFHSVSLLFLPALPLADAPRQKQLSNCKSTPSRGRLSMPMRPFCSAGNNFSRLFYAAASAETSIPIFSKKVLTNAVQSAIIYKR